MALRRSPVIQREKVKHLCEARAANQITFSPETSDTLATAANRRHSENQAPCPTFGCNAQCVLPFCGVSPPASRRAILCVRRIHCRQVSCNNPVALPACTSRRAQIVLAETVPTRRAAEGGGAPGSQFGGDQSDPSSEYISLLISDFIECKESCRPRSRYDPGLLVLQRIQPHDPEP